MTLTDQIEAMASNSGPHIDKFAVTKQFLMAVLHALQRRSVCPHCEEREAYTIPVERCDAGGYAAMERAAVDRMTARSAL